MPSNDDDADADLTWRQKMIKMLTMIGQLKRKGKFDMNSEFMTSRRRSSKAKPANLAQNAISDPNEVDPNMLMFGNLDGKPKGSILDDINGNQESLTSNVGGYTPTEFPLEAKLLQPSYALEPASPSSDFDSGAAAARNENELNISNK